MTDQKLKITGKNFDLTEAIKANVNEKMTKVFEHDHTSKVSVVLEEQTSHNPPEFRAAGNITIHDKTYHVESTTEDMYKSINELSKLMLRDIRREHCKFEAGRVKDEQ